MASAVFGLSEEHKDRRCHRRLTRMAHTIGVMPAPSSVPSVGRARELVLRYGYHSSVYQILNKGISHWHAPHAPAVVGYVRRHRLVIAAGAPVCPESSLGHV